MIFLREFVRAVFVGLANLLRFKRMPAAFYARNQNILESICTAYDENNGRVALVKTGFYIFTGDDMVIYSHNQNQSGRFDLASSKWVKVSNINDRAKRLIGFSGDIGVDFLEYLRDYLDDPNLSNNSYVTLFECCNSRGILFPMVSETISFRKTLWTVNMCIE